MASIFRRALGSDFERLHPEIQKRFGFNSTHYQAAIGKGVMKKVKSKWYIRPFLLLGSLRHILIPESGDQIPFTIYNYAYTDDFGRETVTFVRTFQFGEKTRRFDATMIYSEEREQIVDYLGTHQHLAVDLEVSAAENGGLRLRSGEQRFYEKWIGFRFPLWLSGAAEVCEWYNPEENCFHIEVVVTNRWLGRLFSYTGTFQVEYIPVQPGEVPTEIQPIRTERRE